MSALVALSRSVRAVSADGTDPDVLATVLAWACGPRRNLDVLRRRVRDATDRGEYLGEGRGEEGEATGADGGADDGAGAARRLAAVARDGGGPDVALVDVAHRIVGTWARLGVRVALVGDPAYPSTLAEGWPDLDAPVLLAWRGEPPASAGPGVAIVGSRAATPYGTAVAELIGAAVARAGGRVVSGGAVGVDAAAHAAAIGLPGGTTVVLGCGHAVAYPAPHARPGGLFDRILDDGGTLVSELLPEVTAHPGVIRARNRIVAGLATTTVVVEGGSRSGALLTASAAADRGREVIAVPGDVLAPGSAAPLRLLAEGARPFTAPRDVLGPAGLEGRPHARGTAGAHPGTGAGTGRDPDDGAGLGWEDVVEGSEERLPPPVLRALARAGVRGVAAEELAVEHPAGASGLLVDLTRARIAGLVEQLPGGTVRLAPTRPSVR